MEQGREGDKEGKGGQGDVYQEMSQKPRLIPQSGNQSKMMCARVYNLR